MTGKNEYEFHKVEHTLKRYKTQLCVTRLLLFAKCLFKIYGVIVDLDYEHLSSNPNLLE